MLLFSVNPAFDLLPATEDMEQYFSEASYEAGLGGIHPDRAELYRLCEQRGVGITVMKGYAGGRLFSESTSPFGEHLPLRRGPDPGAVHPLRPDPAGGGQHPGGL